MIPIPKFIFHTLIRLPVVGRPLRRSPDEIEVSSNSVRVPFLWVVDSMLRALVCLALVGVTIYLVIENLPESPVNDVALADAVYLEEDDFKKFLGFYDREEIMQILELNVEDREVTDPLRRQGIVNQILAADKLGKSPMQSRKRLGISRELELRTELSLSDLENNRFDPDNNKRLTELATLYEGINFQDEDETTESLKEKAGIGLVLANFVASVEEPSDESAAIKEGAASEKLQQLGQKFVISKQSEATIFKLVRLSRNRLKQLNKSTECCDTLQDLLAEVNRANRERAIEEFSNLDCTSASSSTLDYLEEEEPKRKDRFLRDFESKLRRMIQCGDLGESDFSVMMDKLEGLFHGGWHHATRRILSEVAVLMEEAGEFPELEQRKIRLRQLLDRIGQTLSDADLKTAANRPAELAGDRMISTFVVYVSATEQDRLQESNAIIRQMARVYNSLITTKRLNFFGVVVHQDAEEEEAIKVVSTMAELLKPIQFLRLSTTSNAGKELTDMVPVDQLPHVLILDKNNRIVAIDPRPTQTIEIVGKLKLMDR